MEMTGSRSTARVVGAHVGAFEGRRGCSPSYKTETVSPYMQAFVLLDGEQKFMLDGMPFHLEAGSGRGAGPVAGMFCISHPCPLTFQTETDVLMRKVRISAPLDWFSALAGEEGARVPELARFFSGHLSRHVFTPYPRLIELAEQILDPPPSLSGEFLALYRQSRGLEILSHICRSLVDTEGRECAAITTRALRQSEKAREFILSHLSEPLSIDRIAREVGATRSSLQRGFASSFGMSIADFTRQSRLEAAKDAIERRGTSIAQAAYLAGYAHHSNFTTAFKRAYGVPPKLKRR